MNMQRKIFRKLAQYHTCAKHDDCLALTDRALSLAVHRKGGDVSFDSRATRSARAKEDKITFGTNTCTKHQSRSPRRE
ncbi:hypothetical protein BWQ96_08583 [Gracilariopsis chorda]|uniref:Uncharacterized protein n=1 Tax=Gracilariopsis chorda TaxID=448386 RepID=A0A2V3II34_9FLOR|nr:hypothetical protein BWQ96_08583 [Gracilariopsis chorda]|eukprot:PXF41698.1 hypothetical protein BWQ96_08583 [Gracilariopsis chorda]